MRSKTSIFLVLACLLLTASISAFAQPVWTVPWNEDDARIVYEGGATQVNGYYPSLIKNPDTDSEYRYLMWYRDERCGIVKFTKSRDGIEWQPSVAVTGLTNAHHVQVVYLGDVEIYKIFYWDTSSLYSISPDGSVNDIRTAESTDGVNWTPDIPIKQAADYELIEGVSSAFNWGSYGPVAVKYNPVPTAFATLTDKDTTNPPTDYKYALWYDCASSIRRVTSLAVSDDGEIFYQWHLLHSDISAENRAAFPVLDHGSTGAWDHGYATHGAIVPDSQDPGTWYFYYSGGEYGGSHRLYEGIGMASSTDFGVTWTRENGGNPILRYETDAWSFKRCYTPSMVYEGADVYKMWISARGSDSFKGIALFGISTVPPAITVTYPNGGEVFEIGTAHNIVWDTYGAVGPVKIEYSIDNGSNWNSIDDAAPNTGSYSWTIPNAPSTTCLIRISEAADGAPVDTSDNTFAISTCPTTDTITLTSPNGGEGLTIGMAHNITWTKTGSVGDVNIEYSIDNGGYWSSIVQSTENDGIYEWSVPDTPSNYCLVRISEAYDGNPIDESNSVFYIGSPCGTTWEPGTYIGSPDRTAVTYNGSSLFVSVGYFGTIYTSPNGTNWTKQTSGTASHLHAVKYINTGTRSHFVAVGFDGTIIESTNGIDWNDCSQSGVTHLKGISYGNNLYVAVGYGGHIYTSSDCLQWNLTIAKDGNGVNVTNRLEDIVYSTELSRFVIAGGTGTILTSPDAVTWSKKSSGTDKNLKGAAYGNGVFAVVSVWGAIVTSIDGGDTWSLKAEPAVWGDSLFSVTYGNSMFVAVGYMGRTLTSGDDGETWTEQVHQKTLDATFYGVVYGNSRFVTVGGDVPAEEDKFYYSADPGTGPWTWNPAEYSGLSDLKAVAFNGASIFTAVGNDGTILTSADGINWIQRSSGTVSHLLGVKYVNSHFVALGFDGTIISSTDGITWENRSQSGITQHLTSIAYGNSHYIAVGYGCAIYTSTDCRLWTSIIVTDGNGDVIPNRLEDIVYSTEQTRFVIVGGVGTILTSTDGSTWTPVASNTGKNLKGIAYGGGLFAAGSTRGALIDSSDGENWALQEASTTWGKSLFSFTFGNSILLAVGYEGRTVAYTDEGWETIAPKGNIDTTLYGVTYGVSKFVAVGGDVTGEEAKVFFSPCPFGN
ncbi:MAG: hypothetical protein GY757_39570 [bacterium]|nr:hypothetical protein [bacterium]